ncbi:hypothetical protein [Staphylococcus capitis]|uniref:hypothetical protein n=1 Tax=Staphylococcus capitis TaxID=29388 RepID=UPI0011A7D0A1|nr:hypothetical protein [Staphylococcus capitis]
MYLIGEDGGNDEEVISLRLEEVEKEVNVLSKEVDDREINFIMVEVGKEGKSVDDKSDKIVEDGREFVYEDEFEKEEEIE